MVSEYFSIVGRGGSWDLVTVSRIDGIWSSRTRRLARRLRPRSDRDASAAVAASSARLTVTSTISYCDLRLWRSACRLFWAT